MSRGTVVDRSAGHPATRLTPCMALRGNARTVAPFSCPRHPAASYPLGPSARTLLGVHTLTFRQSTLCRDRTPCMRPPLQTRSSIPFCRCVVQATLAGVRISSADWFKAGVARQRVGPISLGIAPRACMILSKLLLLLLFLLLLLQGEDRSVVTTVTTTKSGDAHALTVAGLQSRSLKERKHKPDNCLSAERLSANRPPPPPPPPPPPSPYLQHVKRG